jgi:transglutaminase-like putative cysteine protease
MIKLQLQLELRYDVGPQGCDFIFNFHAARTRHQTVTAEHLRLSQDVESQLDDDPATGNRQLRLHAGPGPLQVSYETSLEIRHHVADPQTLHELPMSQLPAHVLPYLYPSRYCQSDRLLNLAASEFGRLSPGHARVQAIHDWVLQRVTFTSNTSNANTSAVDTLIERVGVCRDFAHLMIALCRAVNIPARFTTGTDYGAPVALGPPDFHAYVEVFLSGRWYIFDPSGTSIPMGFVRLATGRDAADVAFATMFGNVSAYAPVVHIEAVRDPAADAVMPHHCSSALSTDDGQLSQR